MRTAPILPDIRASGGAAQVLRRALFALASLRLTLAALALLAVATLAAWQSLPGSDLALVAPLALLALNLLASIATHPAFRARPALLVFHLALLALVLLAGLGRLTYLKGRVELSEGQSFEGVLTEMEQGVLHRGPLAALRFTNLGFRIDYAPQLRRDRTRNDIAWQDEAGLPQRAEIGDHRPLVLQGYRFYTSFNKGYAPVFTWLPLRGGPQRGSIHLPAYPLHEFRQALEWTPPGSATTLWTLLDFDETILDPERPSAFRVPGVHRLVLRYGGERAELQPGESLLLPEGRLRYDGLSTWMGYTVSYDPTTPWLVAAALLAALSLVWHLFDRLRAGRKVDL